MSKLNDYTVESPAEKPVDYKAFMDEYLAAREQYNKSHDPADYKAMNDIYTKYGIPQEERRAVNTIAVMQGNVAHEGGQEVARIPAAAYHAAVTSGNFNVITGTLKNFANDDLINELTGNKYPALGEIFKSDRKNSLVAMSAFGLFKDGDDYVVKVNPEKFQLYDYETFFKSDIEAVTAGSKVTVPDSRDLSDIRAAASAGVMAQLSEPVAPREDQHQQLGGANSDRSRQDRNITGLNAGNLYNELMTQESNGEHQEENINTGIGR